MAQHCPRIHSLIILALLVEVASAFLVGGPLDLFVDSFTTLGIGPSPAIHRRKTLGAPRSPILSSNGSGEIDELLPNTDDRSNDNTATPIETEPHASAPNDEAPTKVGGYQRIEDWHEKTQDSQHVIRQLKQEKARWNKAFDNLENN